jgi:hypothetical protein
MERDCICIQRCASTLVLAALLRVDTPGLVSWLILDCRGGTHHHGHLDIYYMAEVLLPSFGAQYAPWLLQMDNDTVPIRASTNTVPGGTHTGAATSVARYPLPLDQLMHR